jgi:arsenate reductase (thioredoxin)
MKYVLFVCTKNAGRSQMAQAFFDRAAPPDIRAGSAGQEPAPHIWPEVVEAMREVDLDIAHRKPQKLSVEMQLHADWTVTLACGASCPYVPTTVEDWDVPDLAGRPRDEVREIRDEIEQRVDDLIVNRLDAIRSDRTAHQARLYRMLPTLIREFDGLRMPEEIRGCADAILDDYDHVSIRSHVMTLATKRTRECLRADHCAALETIA